MHTSRPGTTVGKKNQADNRLTQHRLFMHIYICMQISCYGQDDPEMKFCGSLLPAEMTYYCEKLEVIFYTDLSTERNGFKMRFIVNQPLSGLCRILWF